MLQQVELKQEKRTLQQELEELQRRYRALNNQEMPSSNVREVMLFLSKDTSAASQLFLTLC